MSEKLPIRVAFHGLAAGGEAVGRGADGKTVFAPFAARGDVARVQIGEEKKTFSRGVIEAIEIESPSRTTPQCPQFRPQTPLHSCGGCAWQHVSLGQQRDAKRDMVQNALSRLGGQNVEVEATCGGAGYAYRNKADFVVGREGIGFFARESHDLIAAKVCPIQHPQNEEILRAANQILQENPQFAFDAATGRGDWRRLVARVSTGGETLTTIVTAHSSWSESERVAALLRERVPSLVGVLARGPKSEAKRVWGRDWLVERANGLDFRVSGEAFWQVNAEISPLLALGALELAEVKAGQRALDLFCGAGFFALHLARSGADVMGIETHRGAIRDAIWNAKNAGLKAQFRAGDAARELGRFKRGDFDLILLDPPRAGAAACLESLQRIAPQRIVYVSCDPATLARDAKTLCGGYVLRRALAFDLFPQTAHVETVALFERRD
ncbi:MAG: 23S rRNA (uracil(1939)-C(5))-methyltransferase RlmD [Armatimonadetes bacterium]|nr:23S rRNA (uracil(1939)-C(5))-methyltransferase RlmD [Armatimonadota bacterium]